VASERGRIRVEARLVGLEAPPAVHAIRGREEISRPFRYEVDFEAPEIDLDKIRGSTALLALDDPGGRIRHLSGVVSRLEMLASDAAVEQHRYRIHLAPLPQLLALRHGFRIFQGKSAPDVVKSVIDDAGIEASARRFDLAGSYPKRDHCMQYDETEWQFLCRLLEEEGIWFRFDQTASGHAMVIADASGKAPKADPVSLPFVADAALHGSELRAWGLVQISRTAIATAIADDYDFAHPSLDLRAAASAADGHGTWFEYPVRATAPADTKRLAKVRLEEHRSRRRAVRFATNALGLQAGQRVEIADHPSAGGEYFVTAISWHVRLEEETTAASPLVDAGAVEAFFEVDAVPADQPFRPARTTPRPRVAGPQTARVTGPAGEEIHCDAHGRVKLQFHWDRDGALDDKSSAWIRVVQPHSTGAVMIPRVGWEVLVDFLEGDPDRPVCTGRVYNPLFPPPYELPAQKTVTSHRSDSSPGGAGANELRFDDAPGAQQVFLNAQRDLHIVAAEKKKARVGKEQQLSVTASNKEKVSAGDQISVTKSQELKVGGAQKISAGTRKVEVGGDASQEVKAGSTLKVGGIEMVKVGNPIQALVQLAATEAIEQAAALAGAAASNATQAIVAPLKPALDAISKAAGMLPKLSGPVAGLLGSDPAGALPIPPEASQALALADPQQLGDAVSSAVTGAAASAAPAVAQAIAQAMGGGSGAVHLTVGGNLDVQIGAVEVVNTVAGISFGVGGSSKETVGGARLELAKGGRSESTKGDKIELVGGAYIVKASEGISLEADGNVALNVGAVMKQKIDGGHSISSEGPAVLMTSRLKMEASEKITLKCGLSEVVLSSDGIAVKGLDVTVEGSDIKLTPPAIGPG
jgi:type VI secretion system secreted protein VgrG